MKRLLSALIISAILIFPLTGCAAQTTKATENPANTVVKSDPVSEGLVTPRERLGLDAPVSPEWVTSLPEAATATQLFIVAQVSADTTAWVSMHEKSSDGTWYMIMSTPGYIGRNGLGKTKEGDGMTPVGSFSFNRAFGIADDPGCKISYVKVNDDTYWSGDVNYRYNELIDIKDYPDLNKDDSEHIVDYSYEYQYCLNISYNADGTAGAGSAIFLHCLGDRKPRTGGCVAIPMDQMYFVMQHVDPSCVVLIDSLENMGGDF